MSYIVIFPVYLRMALIFTDFPTGSGSQPCAVFGNLRIPNSFLSKLEKFQHIFPVPNIKYSCVVLYWSHLYLLFIYALKYILP